MKFLKGCLIGVVVFVIGAFLVFTLFIKGVDHSIKKVQKDNNDKSAVYQELVDKMQWTEAADNLGFDTKSGILENTTSDEIEYIQLEYDTVDKDGVVVFHSMTNETHIKPGEKRKIEIKAFKKEAVKINITKVSSSVVS